MWIEPTALCLGNRAFTFAYPDSETPNLTVLNLPTENKRPYFVWGDNGREAASLFVTNTNHTY